MGMIQHRALGMKIGIGAVLVLAGAVLSHLAGEGLYAQDAAKPTHR